MIFLNNTCLVTSVVFFKIKLYLGLFFFFLIQPVSYKFLLTELEWILGQAGAVPTELEADPRPQVRDVLFSKLKSNDDDLSDDNDW